MPPHWRVSLLATILHACIFLWKLNFWFEFETANQLGFEPESMRPKAAMLINDRFVRILLSFCFTPFTHSLCRKNTKTFLNIGIKCATLPTKHFMLISKLARYNETGLLLNQCLMFCLLWTLIVHIHYINGVYPITLTICTWYLIELQLFSDTRIKILQG